MNEKFINLYNDVFDENNNVKNCGRDKCIELIKECNLLNVDYDFGDENTGFMNINNIILLKMGSIKIRDLG